METPQPTPNEKSSEDLAYLGEVLRDGRSLIVVRTDSQEIAKVAAEILDRMGISEQWRMSGRMQTASRQIGGITVVDINPSAEIEDLDGCLKVEPNGPLSARARAERAEAQRSLAEENTGAPAKP